jgi:ABC-type dipeptide/oligopeptide/nickel transport system permease subunit
MGSKPTETPAEPPVSFLKENWIWIVAPMVLILSAVIWIVFCSDGPTDPVAPHQYPMFD